MPNTVVIGLDGAAWHLLDPMIEAGAMPRLAALKQRGAWGRLTSTIPTYTPPAWTSAATGVNPGRHGIYGFVDGHAQSEHQELMHSGRIASPALWEIANAQGTRAGIYNLPLTYPPRPLDGWMVSGMMTPGYGEELTGFASWSGKGGNEALEATILQWAPGYVVDVSANYEKDWRDETLCHTTLTSITQREKVLEGLLQLDPVPVVFSVLEAPDRLQHVYYRYMDPTDELYDSEAGKRIGEKVVECFAAMDRIAGMLEDYADGGGVIVCSDHGFTAWEVSVHVNALLQEWGYLTIKPQAAAMQTRAARSVVPVAKRLLPRRVARAAKGKTFAGVDWAKTKAFASPIPQQGIFVNVEGRERYGIVPQAELETLKDELVARFETLTDPSGAPVTDKVWRSQDLFNGPKASIAPDVLPVLRDHRYELDDELFHKKPFTDVSDLPRGVHHPDGIGIVAGPGVAPGGHLDSSILDVTPTLLYLAGLKVPEGLDGDVMTGALHESALAERPVETTDALSSSERNEESPYSQEEETAIEDALRGLGYL